MAFTISDFQKTIPTALVKTGERLFKNEAVKTLTNTKADEWTAEVSDKEVFNVEIMLDDERNILDHFCDCPTENEYCAHQVAALFKLRQALPEHEKKQAKTKVKKEKEVKVKKKTDPVSVILDEVSFAELKEFVQNAAAKQKEFKNMLLVHFSDKSENNNRKYYSDVLRTGISNVKRSGPLNVKDTKRFLPIAEQLWKKAEESVQKNHLKDAAQIFLAIIETLTHQSERLSDNNGVANQIIENAYKQLKSLIEKVPFEFQKVVSLEFFEVLETDMPFYYNHFRRVTFNVLELFLHYPDLHFNYAQFLDTLLNQPNISSKNNRPFWSSIGGISDDGTLEVELAKLRRKLYETQNQTDKIPAFLARFQHIDSFRKEYIEYCIAQKDYPEARKVLEKFLNSKDLTFRTNSVNKYWFETLLKICERQGDVQGQISTLRLQFVITDYEKMELLVPLKKLCTPQQWDTAITDFKKTLLKKDAETQYHGYYSSRIYDKPFPSKIANLLVFDERWDELWELVSTHKKFEGYGLYGKYLLQTHAEALFKHFKLNIRKWIDNASSMDDYHAVAKILSLLNSMNEEGNELAQNQVAHIRIAHKRKNQFLSLLKAEGL